MYPSSTSSSFQTSSISGGGLIRYASAPDSFLTAAVNSDILATREFSSPAGFFRSDSLISTAIMASRNDLNLSRRGNRSREEQTIDGLGGAMFSHSGSSPAGFHNQLVSGSAAGDTNAGFSVTRGIAISDLKGIAETGGGGMSRLNSQLMISFTGKESLSRISQGAEEVAAAIGNSKKSAHSYAATRGGAAALAASSSNPIMFSVAQPSRGKNVNNGLDAMESQFQFSISQAAHEEMASMEKLVNLPQDSVTCRIRAKRGCATHPRSIAERERRTRISGKLKKLHDVVLAPNMDKQTSYSDMLDIAVQHITSLQTQVEKLHKSLDGCICGFKKPANS